MSWLATCAAARATPRSSTRSRCTSASSSSGRTMATEAPLSSSATEAEEVVTAAGRVVGHRHAHHDFVDKVKGTMLYAADHQPPGMLHGRVVRSTVPSADIVSIDLEAARNLRGVAAIVVAADVPDNSLIVRASGGLGELAVEMPILASDRVR